MSHAIGAYSQHSWLGMNKWTTNHSPDRRYYIARNDTVMLREYGNYVFGLWALKSSKQGARALGEPLPNRRSGELGTMRM